MMKNERSAVELDIIKNGNHSEPSFLNGSFLSNNSLSIEAT